MSVSSSYSIQYFVVSAWIVGYTEVWPERACGQARQLRQSFQRLWSG